MAANTARMLEVTSWEGRRLLVKRYSAEKRIYEFRSRRVVITRETNDVPQN